MNKSILNLGKALSKAEQNSINGGIYRKQWHCPEGEIRCTTYFGGNSCCPSLD
ncbi:MAG: hypothetical protein V3V28_01910 [Polaribacter sp.]|uniref:hypothetical protein n=1 Tax=Polaribacter sp. TaxID=1920175 RepID=UPI002F35FCD3